MITYLLVPWLVAAVVSPTPASAGAVKTCPTVEVRSMESSFERAPHFSRDIPQPTDITGKLIAVVSHGPVLGSMDSPKLEVKFTCTPKGINATATVSRSENYVGAALQNVLWRPRLTIHLSPTAKESVLDVVWRMRLSNGKQLEKSETPPYQTEQYPASTITVLRSGPK